MASGRKVTIKSGPRAGTVVDVDAQDNDTEPTNNSTGKRKTYMEIADEMSGDGNTASNAGKQAQSSDNANKYN